MKIALLGKGKSGSKLPLIHDNVIAYNSSSHISADELSKADVIVSFLPGEAFKSYLDILLKTKKPVVCASTGFEWPKDIDQELKQNGTAWVYSSNFSLGMSAVKMMAENMGLLAELLREGEFRIFETHHTKKKDSPSGTAKSLKQWLNADCQIVSRREGDVVGIHEAVFETPYEKVTLRHEAKDRKLFAEGAVWSARRLHARKVPTGLNEFFDLVSSRKEEL